MPLPFHPTSAKAAPTARLPNGTVAGPIRTHRAKHASSTTSPRTEARRRIKKSSNNPGTSGSTSRGAGEAFNPRSFTPHPLLLRTEHHAHTSTSNQTIEEPGIYKRFSAMAIGPVLSVERLGDVDTWNARRSDRNRGLEGSDHVNGLPSHAPWLGQNYSTKFHGGSGGPKPRHIADPPVSYSVRSPRPLPSLPGTVVSQPSSPRDAHLYPGPGVSLDPKALPLFPSVGIGGVAPGMHHHLHSHEHWHHGMSCCGSVLPLPLSERRAHFWVADENDLYEDESDDGSDSVYADEGYSE